MTQPTTASGRNLSQPLFVPTLMPMHSLSQQAVLTSKNAGTSVVPPASMTSVITCAGGFVPGNSGAAGVASSTHTTLSSSMAQSQSMADLYLCNTSNNASGDFSIFSIFLTHTYALCMPLVLDSR